jgi:ubiquitin C-terminal hydrolase
MVIAKNNSVDLSDAYGLGAGSALYELQGFVWNQSGKVDAQGESGGHFIAYVNRGGVWYECDDARITKIDADTEKAREFEDRKNQLILGLFVKIS